MAIPNAPSFASFDVTARTEGRAVDSVLWDYMFAKSRLLEVIGTGPKINQQRYEWVNIGSTAITVTAEDTSNTTFDSSASDTGLEVSVADAAKLMPGALLMNVSRATPIGTYQRNELLQVVTVDKDTGVCVLARDIGAFNSGTGSSSHAATDVLRLIATPHQEGSVASLDPNAYSAQSILDNYTAIQTVKLQATGSQMARDMEVVASDLERQYAREMLNLKNQLVGLVLYGFNSSTAVGSDTVIRNSKGIIDFLVDNINSSNALVDYTTTTLTADAINALFLKLWNNGADPSEPYKIVTSGASGQVISSWESDKVRTTWQEGRVGRHVTEFVSDLGFTAEVIVDPIVSKSDLLIIQPEKVKVIPFRPFFRTEWGLDTSAPNGDDVYYTRVIGEHTLQVVDPAYAHAAATNLAWV
jgi:hypothetical protein